MSSGETKFSSYEDDYKVFVRKTINAVLEDKVYNKDEAQVWANEITKSIMEGLYQHQNALKFLVSTTIYKKGTASLHFSSSCLWDRETDGTITIKEENDSFLCFVVLFGIL